MWGWLWAGWALGTPGDGVYAGVGGAFGPRRGVEVPVHGGAGGSGTAWLRRRLQPGDPVLISIANDNSSYGYVAQLRALWGTAPYLVVDGVAYAASTSGRWRPGIWAPIPRTAADRLAATGVPRRDREPLGQGLVGQFSAAPASLGAPIPIVLELAHHGPPVELVLGGRQRGARNNRFDLVVSLGDRVLPRIEAPDFGGVSTTILLEEGDTHHWSVDLRDWATILEPGVYTVRATYRGELHRPGEPWGTEQLHRVWDLVLEQELELVIAQ